MTHAFHLPHADPRLLAVGVAALLAGAGGALGVSALVERDGSAAPAEVRIVPVASDDQPTALGPGSHCYAKYGC